MTRYRKVDESPIRVLFEVSRTNGLWTYKLAEDLTLEEFASILEDNGSALPSNAVIEEAEVLIDELLREHYPGIKEEA